jgi:hypothetical protein
MRNVKASRSMTPAQTLARLKLTKEALTKLDKDLSQTPLFEVNSDLEREWAFWIMEGKSQLEVLIERLERAQRG